MQCVKKKKGLFCEHTQEQHFLTSIERHIGHQRPKKRGKKEGRGNKKRLRRTAGKMADKELPNPLLNPRLFVLDCALYRARGGEEPPSQKKNRGCEKRGVHLGLTRSIGHNVQIKTQKKREKKKKKKKKPRKKEKRNRKKRSPKKQQTIKKQIPHQSNPFHK